ncbi:MAG TPA: GNAT family N-acetyltransferase [Azospirillaceae bacterium]|nr:GNAT family N-acetyltransferase [Azospirillaceae bacterium]
MPDSSAGGLTRRLLLAVPVTVRPCREPDLRDLEWFGAFTHHREIMANAFASQSRGEAVLLVAEANGFPIGQVWIDLKQKAALDTALLWAVRVFTPFRRAGLGAGLMTATEPIIRDRGLGWAELGVERDNPDARRFYERLGYRLTGTEKGYYTYTTPDGTYVKAPLDLWVMRKELRYARLPQPAEDGESAPLARRLR